MELRQLTNLSKVGRDDRIFWLQQTPVFQLAIEMESMLRST